MLDTLGQFAHHIQQAIDIVDNINLPKIYNIHNIIISGFGGSVISGDIIQSYLQSRLSIPIFVNRSPELPGWIRKNTLVFIQSYSGDTDETMLSFRNAVEKKATIIGVSSGGKLKRYCDARSLPHILLPSRFQSRTALPFYLFCCLRSLEITGLLTLDQKTAYNESMNMAKETISQINSSVPSEHNVSKQIALSISDTIPQLYSYGIYRPITRRWASQFNENSKIISKYDDITESNHNDINGWAENPRLSHLFSCIFFRDKSLEHPIIRKRIEFMKQLFESVSSKIIEVPVIGKQDLEKMIYLLLVGDYASCYLAYLRNVEPAAHPIIKTLNEELSR
jgi:glucose/mannose-6-phosphate isomerase